MKHHFLNPKFSFGLLLGLLTVFYIGFELYTYYNDPHSENPADWIEQSLDRSEQLFAETHDNFSDQTVRLAGQIQDELVNQVSRRTIYDIMASYPFWGSALYRNGDFFTWEGFALSSPPTIEDLPDGTIYINVFRHNNVIYLLGKLSFTIGEDDRFTLKTKQRLEQKNVIPVARGQEYSLSKDPKLRDTFPVEFTFFDPAPHPLHSYRKLQTASSDSVGIVHADESDIAAYISSREVKSEQRRTFFHILFFLFGSVLFFYLFYYRGGWLNLLIQLVVIFLVWIMVVHSDITSRWATLYFSGFTGAQLTSLNTIFTYVLHAVFSFFIAVSIITTLIKKWNLSNPEKHYQTFFYSLFFGGVSVALILFFLLTTFQTAYQADLPLLSLELIPGPAVLIFYIATALFISSIASLLITFWWYLFITEKDKSVVIGLIAFVSFFSFYFIADLILEPALFELWKILLSLGLFSVTIGTAIYIYSYPNSYLQLSGFRLLLLVALLSSGSGYVIYYQANADLIDSKLENTAKEFYEEEDETVRDITFTLLSSLENRLNYITLQDIEERRSSLQARFQQAIQSSLREDWRRYSYDIQLIDQEGEQISDFATNFDSPGAGFYNLIRIQTSYEQEQIRRETNRPVIQGRPAALARDIYTTFQRGWIPIYDSLEPDRIIAWIVAAVYIERPDFNKPIRAVLAASTDEDWRQSYYVAEYERNSLNRSTVMGIYANQPMYNRLSDREVEIADRDSVAFISTLTSQGSFREVLMKRPESKIVKASTPKPGFSNHLFSFFRFNIIILAAGFVFFPLFSLLGLTKFRLFAQNHLFRQRLLDGLALATLVFLVVLVATTQYAVDHQNEKNLQREIVTKLDNLTESIRSGQQLPGQFREFISLEGVNIPIDADAIFYRNQIVVESTTPQIFQQNLMPEMLSYPIHDFLYNRQRKHLVDTIEIGDEKLLVGYQVIPSNGPRPIGVAAIPTFLQSPLYTEQLLETTSYLLVIYLIVFSAFIFGTVLFSNRLTRPLRSIQEGLQKISGGDLETTIQVHSKDEFGALSRAYNTMVRKLKILQENLAEAEREAAWKEMAQQVAHEIKNPLTPMKLNLQHLKRQIEINPEDAKKLQKQIERTTANIIEQIDSLDKIASDFSTFARPVQETFGDVEINALIRSVADLYNTDSDNLIECKLYPKPLTINGSSVDLRRALINLVKNSYEASGREADIVIRSNRRGKKITIDVQDNGEGIPEDFRDKIFVPNFSTKSSGTGLGLAITKKIIDAHGGRISFNTVVGDGTTFQIELPLK